jgi:uncharacterized protein DUF6883
MAPLPNSGRAILDVGKLEDYCLNLDHPRGRHKARLFRESLGLTRDDAQWLRRLILGAIAGSNAIELATDRFGARWRVDVPVSRHGKSGVVRTIWIVRTGEDVPRFVTCWVL